MRKLLIVIVVVLIAMLAGWVTFNRSPGEATFTIETGKMKDDVERAFEEGKRTLQEHIPSENEPPAK